MKLRSESSLPPDLAEWPGIATYVWWVAEDQLVWSRGMLDIYGLSAAPRCEAEFLALIHPEDRIRMEATAVAILGGGDTYGHEFRIIRADGAVRMIHDRGWLERDSAGKVLRVRGLNLDVTEQRRLAAAPHWPGHRGKDIATPSADGHDRAPAGPEDGAIDAVPELNDALMRAIADAPLMIAVHEGPEHRLRFANTQHRRLLGAEPRAGDPMRLRIASPARDSVLEAFDHVFHTGLMQVLAPLQVAVPGDAEGQARWVQLRLQPWHRRDGAVGGVVCFCSDVSDQMAAVAAIKQAQAAVAQELQEVQALYAQAPLGLALLDAGLRFRRINPALAQINGFSVEQHLGRYAFDLLPELRESAEPIMQQVLATGEAVRDVAVTGSTPAQPDVVHHWRAQFYPVRGQDGTVRGVGVVVEEVTERVTLERALHDSEERLRLAAEGAGFGVHDFDPATQTAAWSTGMPRILGLDPRAGASMEQVIAHIHPDDRTRAVTEMEAIQRRLGPYEMVVRVVRPDGAVRWILDHGHALGPIDPDTGLVSRVIGVVSDITQRRQAEEHIRLLMREMNHRSKNLLSVVQAIAWQTASTVAGGDAVAPLGSGNDDFLMRFSDRITALAASQDLLVHSNWAGVDLEALVRGQLAFLRDAHDHRILLSGPPVRINAAAAEALGMALHELATNAVKHGALSTTAVAAGGGAGGAGHLPADQGRLGHVQLQWSLDLEHAPGRFRIRWHEQDGPPVQPPTRRGFGTTVIERMAAGSLEGEVTLDYAPTGLCWTLSCSALRVLEAPGGIDTWG